MTTLKVIPEEKPEQDDVSFNNKIQNTNEFIKIWIEANVQKPDRWIVWAYSKEKTWAEKIIGKL